MTVAHPFVVGYVMASADPRVDSADAQRKAVEQYCERVKLKLHGCYIDDAAAGRVHIMDRPAGRQLVKDIRRGDHVVVARIDRLADSPVACALALDNWCRQGVLVHLVDVKVVLNPSDPGAQKLVEMLVRLVQAGQRLIGVRGREKLADLKCEGRRYSRHAPFGSRFQTRKGVTNLVPNEAEQTIMRRVGELWIRGHSIDAIRQYLAYTWRVRNRNNREFGCSEIRRMAIRSHGDL